MVIGFTERSQTVSEGMAPPGFDVFQLLIAVATLRTAERERYSALKRPPVQLLWSQ